jgi:hypothetical protein
VVEFNRSDGSVKSVVIETQDDHEDLINELRDLKKMIKIKGNDDVSDRYREMMIQQAEAQKLALLEIEKQK